MKHLSTAAVAFILVALLGSCKNENAEPIEPGYDYFPTQIGSWVEYEVDSVFVDEQFGQPPVHVSYLMRVELDTVIIDAQGRQVQRIERSVMDSITGAWVVRDVWSQYRSSTAAERTEENLRKLRMAFSIRDNLYWDLNVFNTEEALELNYDEIHVPWTNGMLSFDSTVTVVTTFSNNLIDTIIETERYAKHVGMVDKYSVNTNTQYVSSPPGPPTPITTGYRFRMTVIAYGSP